MPTSIYDDPLPYGCRYMAIPPTAFVISQLDACAYHSQSDDSTQGNGLGMSPLETGQHKFHFSEHGLCTACTPQEDSIA